MKLDNCQHDLNGEIYRWKQHWMLWEFLIYRHNNNKKQKNKVKNFLKPILVLNRKAIRLIKDETYDYCDAMNDNNCNPIKC